MILSLVPIGFVSGDGIAQSAAYARGGWHWNPNHLLLEPLGAWWQGTMTRIGLQRQQPDQLKVLSIVAGAATIGIFRFGVAARVATGRLAANYATAWVALASGFSRLWISDETHMAQMPALALFATSFIAYMRSPSLLRAVAIGVFAGLSSLFFISNVLVAVCAASFVSVWHFYAAEPKRAVQFFAGVAIGTMATAGLCLIAASTVVASDQGLLSWLTSYSGGGDSRVTGVYGADLTVRGLAVSAARAVYGSSSSVVDISPVVEIVRDDLAWSARAVTNVAAYLAAALALLVASIAAWQNRRSPPARTALLLVVSWVVATLAFAVFWNNSDDQFFFQLALPLGTLIASAHHYASPSRRRLLASLALLPLAFNAFAMAALIRYPRQERVAMLERALDGAGLVVYPGMDELHQLFFFMKDDAPDRRLAITSLAAQRPAAGLLQLEDRVRSTLSKGQRVDVIEVFDVPRNRNPWKFLRDLGYTQDNVSAIIHRFPVATTSSKVGPFSVRSIPPGIR
ncbi:MAG: hypothetical protein WEE89_20920 [Gemmatimonadota bacterium]